MSESGISNYKTPKSSGQRAFALALWLVVSLASGSLCASQISLSSNTEISSEGYFVLSWQIPEKQKPEDFQLLQSRNSDMRDSHIVPIAKHESVTLSGYDSGDYYFQLMSSLNKSNIVSVSVKHHTLTKAFGFFSAGLALFLILCLSIFFGNRAVRQGDH